PKLQEMMRMHHVRQERLPFIGNSHQFVGAEQGDTGISAFLFHGKAGSGPGPHRHPYDEIQFIREGRGYGLSTARHSKAPRETYLSSRRVKFTASRRLATHP